jgi:cellobiose-specific phosphotransferase system component IIB
MKSKNSYVIVSIIFCLFSMSTSQAQFLNKLKKRVEQKVENAVIEKAANKASEKATNSMDKAFDINPFVGRNEKADASLVADSYDFTWKYSLKMTTKEGEMVFDYYLKPGASYFGFTTAVTESMFTVMDNENKVTVMFMESEGNNIGMVNQMPELDIEEANNESDQFKFEMLPEKTLNSFNCKGIKATNAEYEMVMYFTNQTKVSFDDIFKNKTTKIPTELKDYFDPNEKILMISMDMKDFKNKKSDAKMECIGLEEVKKMISKSDYKFM